MSSLAQKLASAPTPTPIKRGPMAACDPLYGTSDLEDWEAAESLRAKGWSWREVQAEIDKNLGITSPLPLNKFRYHWRRKCFCWSEADRL